VALADARRANGAVGPAADDLRLAVTLDPGRPETWERLASLLEEMGRTGEAQEMRARTDSLAAERAAGRRAEEKAWRTDFLVP